MANSGPDLTLQQTLPLQQTILRNLGDRSYDKRKNAALDIENLIKQLLKQRQIWQRNQRATCANNAHPTGSRPLKNAPIQNCTRRSRARFLQAEKSTAAAVVPLEARLDSPQRLLFTPSQSVQ